MKLNSQKIGRGHNYGILAPNYPLLPQTQKPLVSSLVWSIVHEYLGSGAAFASEENGGEEKPTFARGNDF